VEFGPGLGFRKPRLDDLAEGVYVLEKVAFESEMQISTGIGLVGRLSQKVLSCCSLMYSE
jgi:hypothetical protein